MNLKITKILLAFLFASCTVSNTSTKISKNESVYSITLQAGEYDSVYKVLSSHFADFPKGDKDRKITYNNDESNAVFKINLTRTKLKMVYRSSNGSSNKFEVVKSEIEKMKN